MISFESFKMEDGVPIYVQIVSFVKKGVASGVIKIGDEMPSRRVLSALLGVNPNTVQKAYRILEEEGIVRSLLGSGSVITVGEQKRERIKAQLLESDIKGAVESLKMLGLDKTEALQLMDKYWE